MNAADAVCAASDQEVDWHGIDWARCHRQVRRLQVRIAKATRDGRWGRVQALQWLLTHSFSGKALAVKRVTENHGKRTPGVDGETWTTPVAKSQALLSLTRRGYRPRPLKRVFIPKSNGKQRPLGIPTLRDRAMQALHLLALVPVAETTADRESHGFRPERSTADAREQCFTVLARKCSPQWILEGDIQGCFDNISHDWMLCHIPTDRPILQKWLTAGYVYRKELFPTQAGTPQGGIISPTLANMVLDGLESRLEARFGPKGTKKAGAYQVNLVRYADDFIITGRTQVLLEEEVKPLVTDFLKERGLRLSEEKTQITHIEEGFDFLGWSVRKYHGKLLIRPSRKNVKTFLETLRATVKANRQARQVNLIELLNPLIRGWTNYHKGTVAKETFAKVDKEIWKCLWQWSRRRHPTKGKKWIRERYFHIRGHRTWVFEAQTQAPDGTLRTVRLAMASDTPIRRHVKIRGEANPFDPQYETYFESRLGWKMTDSLRGRTKLLRLWWQQDKTCPVCKEAITKDTGWNIHHIIPREDGGKDNLANLVLVHPNCHRQIHSRKLDVVKTGPL